MSSLILLSVFVAMIWIVLEMKMHFQIQNSKRIKNWMNPAENLFEMLMKAFGISFLLASPQQQIEKTLNRSHNENLSRKEILQICISPFGFWWVLFVGLILISVNPSFVFIAFLFTFLFRQKDLTKAFGYLAVFVLLAEYFGKNLTLITDIVEGSEFIFFITDSRWLSLIAIFSVTLIASFFNKHGGLFSLLAIFLVNRGWISMSGAWLVMLTDFYGGLIFVLLQSFVNAKESQQLLKKKLFSEFFAFSLISMVVSIVIYTVLRSEFVFALETGLSGSHRGLELLAWSTVLLITQIVVLMTWGHFKSIHLKLK